MPNILKTNKRRFINKVISALFVVLFMFSLSGSTNNIAFAEEDEVKGNKVNQEIVDSFIMMQYGEFREGGKNYYHIDSVTERDAEKAKKDSIWANIKDKLFGWTDLDGNFMDKFHSLLNSIVNIFFKVNLFMTSVMLIILDFSFSMNIIGELISELGDLMPTMTGINSNGTLGTSGVFGSLMKYAVLISVVYALYVFIIKRAFLDSFATLMKTVLTLTLAFLMLSNYSTYLTTANKVTNEITAFVIASPSTHESVDDPSRLKMKNTLWSMFVDRPYLYMQYGSHDSTSIGKDRIESLLKTPTGESRYEKVLIDEVVGQDNELMVNSSVLDKLAFSPFYLFVNGMVSLPIFLLCLLLIMLQFWFIVMASIAPFALLIGSIPGFFGVTKRFLIELSIPLALKVFFAFFTVFILMLSDVIYRAQFSLYPDDTSIINYVGMGVFQFILFATLFVLRKRIASIFTSGSQVISGLREQAGGLSPMNGVKKGVQGTATAVGAGVGAYVGGTAGMALGASVGSTAGRALTGQAGVGEIASTAGRTASYMQLDKATSGFSGVGGNGKQTLTDDSKESINGFLSGKKMDQDTIDETMSALEKNGIHDVSEGEMEQQYALMEEQAKNGELDKDFSTGFVDGIKENRAVHKLQSQQSVLRGESENGKPISSTSSTASEFLLNKGASNTLPDVVSQLERRGLNDVSLEEMETQYAKMEQNHINGTNTGDFANNFADGIENQRNIATASEQRQRTEQQNEQVFARMDIPDSMNSQPIENTSQMDAPYMEAPPEDYNRFDSHPMNYDSSMDANRMDSPNMNNQYMDSPNMDSSNMNNQHMDSPNMGGNTMDSPNMGGNAMNSSNMDSPNMGGNAMDSPNMESSNIGGNAMDSPNMESSNVGGNTIDSTPMDSGSMGDNSINSTPIDSASMGGNSMDSSPINSSSMDDNSINSTPMESSNMGGNAIDSTPMDSGSMGGSAMGTHPIDSSSMSGSTIETASMDSSSMNGNTMDGGTIGSTRIDSASISGSAMETTPMDSGSRDSGTPIDSRPIDSGSTSGNAPIDSRPMEQGGSALDRVTGQRGRSIYRQNQESFNNQNVEVDRSEEGESEDV